MRRTCRPRLGFSFLELQVSFVLFSIALMGAAPLAVVQSRQLRQIERKYEPESTNYLTPADSRWARRLGALAYLSSTPLSSPPAPDPFEAFANRVVDDGDPNYHQHNAGSDDWYKANTSEAFGGGFRVNADDDAGDMAVWRFPDCPVGEYTVYATYYTGEWANRDAEYYIYVGSEKPERKKVDQRDELDKDFFEGVFWKKLKDVDVHVQGEDIVVVLSDQKARGYTVFDAVRIEREPPEVHLHWLRNDLNSNVAAAKLHLDYNASHGGGDSYSDPYDTP